jgi:large subunit ribosomal protein L25
MLNLNATIRSELGKKNDKLRREGYIPAVLYGKKVKSTPLSLRYGEFDAAYKEAGENTLLSINIKDAGKANVPQENAVLIRDPMVDPLSLKFIHVDFYQVPMDEEIDISIPLAFENEAPAVKSEGAVLVRNIYEIEVSALPKDLPREISIDLSRLAHTEDAILVKDIAVPPGVKIKAEEDLVVAYVTAPEEEEIAEEPKEEVAAAEIKTEAEGKREEEAAKEAAEKSIG